MHSLRSRLKALAGSLVVAAGLAGSAKAQEGVVSAHAWHGGAVTGSAQVNLENDISLEAEFASAQSAYARGVVGAGDFSIGAGVESDSVGGHVAYQGKASLERGVVRAGLEGRLAAGFGSDPFGESWDIAALSGGVRFELSVSPMKYLVLRSGVYGEGFAGVPVRLLEGQRQLEGSSRVLALSQDRVGVFGDVSLRANAGPIRLELGVREIYEVAHGDVGVWLGDVVDGERVAGEAWSGRLVSRVQCVALFDGNERRSVRVGGFAQHVVGGNFYDHALFREGWSFGVVGSVDVPPFRAWAEARWYPRSELHDFGDDVRVGGSAGLEFVLERKYASVRFVFGGGVNCQRNPDTGFLANEVLGFGGVGIEFGAKSRVRSDLFDYARRSADYRDGEIAGSGGAGRVRRAVAGWQSENVQELANRLDPSSLSDEEKQRLSDLVGQNPSVEDVQEAIQNDAVLSGIYERALNVVQEYAGERGLVLPQIDLLKGPIMTTYGRKMRVSALPARKDAVVSRESGDEASLAAALTREEDVQGDMEELLTYRGFGVGIAKSWDLALLMRNSGRGVLLKEGRMFVVQAPWVEAYTGILGRRSLSDDIRLPLYGWRE